MPYEKSHVITYHEWMKDEVYLLRIPFFAQNLTPTQEIQEATASEPLSLDEEYAMQTSWRSDPDKLTFIACLPLPNLSESHPQSQSVSVSRIPAGLFGATDRMIGDVNLFLSPADEDEEGCIGELELMIAPVRARRKGYGRATILTFLQYIQAHMNEILEEYKKGKADDAQKMQLLQLKVKIGSKNEKSIKLFESLGFIKVEEGPNYFGEFELVFEGLFGEERMRGLLERYGVEGYRKLEYVES